MSELTGNYHQDCNILITANKKLEAERDALQAKLDKISQIHSDNDSQDQIILEIEEIIEGER